MAQYSSASRGSEGEAAAQQSALEVIMPQDYYPTLSSFVRASASDDAKKRGAIYALARSELRQFLARRKANRPTRNQELHALEAAIQRIEFEFAQARQAPRGITSPSVEILPPEPHRPSLAKPSFEPAIRPRWSKAQSLLSLVTGVAVLAGITYFIVGRGLHDDALFATRASTTALESDPALAQRASSTEFPMPSAYGVYAVSDGQLIELDSLPIKIPLRLVPISIPVGSNNMAKLPTGRTQFVVFRPDMASSAPEKVHVRRLAQTSRGSSDSTAELDTRVSWTLSDISYEMKVSPIDGNPAMIFIRPASGFVFPVGHYALVIRSTAYEFSIEGRVANDVQ